MSEHTDSVKNVIADLRASAEKSRASGNDAAAQRVDGLVDRLLPVVGELNRLYDLTKAFPPELGSLHDLPPELLAELTVSKTDELEDQIITAINAFGGEASLDQILVGIFRKFGVAQKRRFVQNKLYKMGMVWSVEGRKGVYTTDNPSDADNQKSVSLGRKVTVEDLQAGLDETDDIPF